MLRWLSVWLLLISGLCKRTHKGPGGSLPNHTYSLLIHPRQFIFGGHEHEHRQLQEHEHSDFMFRNYNVKPKVSASAVPAPAHADAARI